MDKRLTRAGSVSGASSEKPAVTSQQSEASNQPSNNAVSPDKDNTALAALTRADFKVFLQEALRDQVTKDLLADTFKQELTHLQGQVTDLQTENKFLRAKLAAVEDKQDSLEQYSRRSCLRISTPWEEKQGENTEELTIKVAALAGVDLAPAEIDRSHRVGKAGSSPRQLIVKFASFKKRQELYRARLKLRGATTSAADAIFINEDLTQTRAKIAHQARILKKSSKIKDTWTLDGLIFVRKLDNNVSVISTITEMEKYTNEL